MNSDVNGDTPAAANDADLGRSQAIFIAVGLTIVVGGLWLLYNGSGPYHPEIPVSETQGQVSAGS